MPASLVVSPDAVELDALGDSVRVQAVVRDTAGVEITDAEVSWSSTDTTVATVSESGWVVAVSEGVTSIVAVSGALADTATVTVAQSAAGISVNPGAVSFDAVGDSVRLVAIAVDRNDHEIAGAVVNWSSSDPAVATVSEGGWVVARGNGVASVVAESGEAADTVTVDVAQDPVSLTLNPTVLRFDAEGDSVRLDAVVADRLGSPVPGQAITWQTTDEMVAIVEDDGWVISRRDGEARIIATSGALADTVPVTVNKVAVALGVTPSELRLGEADNSTLTATLVDANGYRVFTDVIILPEWTSANPELVTVHSFLGTVTGVRAGGVTTITARVGELTGTATVSVKDQIVFNRNFRVWVMNEDGTDPTELSGPTNGDSEPAWSPDGSKIAFVRVVSGQKDIYVMNADGSGPINLTNNTVEDSGPVWSPDGSRIAFISRRDGGNAKLFVMNANGSSPTRLTASDTGQEWRMAWSPDGTRLAYTCSRGRYQICVINAAGGSETILTTYTEGNSDRPAWSPDGSRIAFQRQVDGEWEIFVMNANGSGQTNLTNRAGDDTTPTWSPDGSRIAFVSTREGSAQIYVMNSDGSNPTRLTFGVATAEAPTWSEDGQWITFVAETNGGARNIHRVPAAGGPVENLTEVATPESTPSLRPRP